MVDMEIESQASRSPTARPGKVPARARRALIVLACALMIACGARAPAPWEDRSDPRPHDPAPVHAPAPAVPIPDAHIVRRGESLYSISFRYGLDWRELAHWNAIGEPYVIHPGQALRLREPAAGMPAVARTAPRLPEPEPEPAPGLPPPADTRAAPDRPQPVPAEEPTRAAAPATGAAERAMAGIRWSWPTEGRVTRRFDPNDTRKGIAIAGDRGQPVMAAAEGQVVYSGTGLIGYGELIIIKHSDSMLSAYGHNNRRLVNEGERVRAGQQIAELGINERNEQILHFEIRRNGQPEDPLRYLPPRG